MEIKVQFKNNILMLQSNGAENPLNGSLDVQIQNRGIRRVTYQGKHISLHKNVKTYLWDRILARGWEVVDESASLNSQEPVLDFRSPAVVNMHFLNGDLVGKYGMTRTQLATTKTKQHRIEKAIGRRTEFVPPKGCYKRKGEWIPEGYVQFAGKWVPPEYANTESYERSQTALRRMKTS